VHSGVSLTVGLLALVAAGILWFFGQHMFPRVTMLLVMGGAIGLAGSQVGGWGNTAITWANDQIAKGLALITGSPGLTQPGTVIWAAGAIVLVAYVGFSFYRKSVDERVLGAAALAPLAAATIPGAFGSTVVSALTTIAGVVTWPIAAVFNLT
jgi:hypothetical protein